MGVVISDLGAKVYYCAETTAGTKPTTGWTELPDVRDAPECSVQQNSIECSSITDKEEKHTPGKTSHTADGLFNLLHTAQAETAWAAILTAQATAEAAGKRMWFEYVYEAGKAYFFPAHCGKLGNAGIGQDGITMPAPITFLEVGTWDTKAIS